MRKIFFFIFCFMFMALSACYPVQNEPEENMPEGILLVRFEKTAFSKHENVKATVYIGLEDGYENYVNEYPSFRIQLRVTNDGRFYGDVGGYVLKYLTFDSLLYDYSIKKDEEPTFNYSEIFTLPSELFFNSKGSFYVFLSLETDGMHKFIPYEFSYSVTDEQIEIKKVKDGRYN